MGTEKQREIESRIHQTVWSSVKDRAPQTPTAASSDKSFLRNRLLWWGLAAIVTVSTVVGVMIF